MSEAAEKPKVRVPIKPGFFTIPDDPNETPKFLCSRCEDCGEYFYPRRRICAQCMSDRMTNVELEGRGTLFSYTFVHIPLFGSTNVEHAEGYGVGQIDLPEGPRIQAPLAGKREDFRIGQEVRAELDVLREKEDKQIMIVRFRPVEKAA
ncbi:MAG: hypothetical protein KatS3mg076_2575 [Candidatus Binatia bacterium]|nr:MAG: hypothetical protein KatS3mg076_2575 [Candidatus Binatia bacterium]